MGEFVALLVTTTSPCTLPAAAGANATLSVVDWSGPRIVPAAAPPWLNPAPETLTLEIVTSAFPRLVRVTLNELVLSTFTVPKFKLSGFAPSRRAVATPVPLNEIVSGEFGASLMSETEPVLLPEDVGANTALNVALLPDGITVGTMRPAILKPLPETLAREIVTLSFPVLLSLMVCELCSPMATLPKLALGGVADRRPCAPTPLPLNARDRDTSRNLSCGLRSEVDLQAYALSRRELQRCRGLAQGETSAADTDLRNGGTAESVITEREDL
jgi:hypothetical protein